MKAIIWSKYGPPEVLQIQDIPKPIPQAKQILVKIMASAVQLKNRNTETTRCAKVYT
jgi:NADPH:quinone reductase-like Zn-dependent oxidoreductase